MITVGLSTFTIGYSCTNYAGHELSLHYFFHFLFISLNPCLVISKLLMCTHFLTIVLCLFSFLLSSLQSVVVVVRPFYMSAVARHFLSFRLSS